MVELKPVALDKAYRIFNVGGTALVSAAHEGKTDVMPATWVCPLNIEPSRVTACVDSTHYTRPLIEKSGYFALALPTKAIARETLYLGSVSKNDEPEKLEKSGAKFFTMDGWDIPGRSRRRLGRSPRFRGRPLEVRDGARGSAHAPLRCGRALLSDWRPDRRRISPGPFVARSGRPPRSGRSSV